MDGLRRWLRSGGGTAAGDDTAPPARLWGRVALIYAGAVLAGWGAAALDLPLPWMIGAVTFSVAAGIAGVPMRVPQITRPIGQGVVAASVGLSFTPVALATLSDMVVAMVGLALLTIVAGFVTAAMLMKLAHTDVITASLASVPMGPVEAANLAGRHGVPPGLVVFSQTLRILLLVVMIPPLIIWVEGQGTDPNAALRAIPWSWTGAALLAVAVATGGALFRAIRFANPFFLGPLGLSAAFAALALPVTAFPYPVLAGAQVLLGVWLGAVVDRPFFTRAGRFVPAALVATLVMIALCFGLGLGIGALTGERWTTMVLAAAPGSVTEMALTAKILQDGVAVVTAFHITRIFIIIPSAPLIFRIMARLAGQELHGPDPGPPRR
ncbi:ammonia monooxygenase [Rhodobacteraceae bacterium WD3A24]|nr:ammonia monooxygenase [Rhodobacteraceae bacterium WD3A24]